MSETPVVDVARARETQLGYKILDIFEKGCKELEKYIVEERKAPTVSNDVSVIEIEGRTGFKYGKGFVPGVKPEFFRGMLDYFLKKEKSGQWMCADSPKKRVSFEETDFVDVVFEDDIRVTVSLVKGENERVERVEPQEVIRKRKLGTPADFVVRAPQHKDRIHLRVGVAREEHIRKSTHEYRSHVQAAERAIMDAFNVSTTIKVLGGIELTLREGPAPVFLFFPPHGEQLARGPMGFSDPLYSIASKHEDMLDRELARKLTWTLLQPSNLPGCKGRPDARLRDTKSLDPKVWLTNLPGRIKFGNGEEYATYSGQYIIRVPLADILCGHGKFAKGVATDDADMDDGSDLRIKVFRCKKRWSFGLRHKQQLDMTETRQSSNLTTLKHEPPVFEVEIEKTLSSSGCRERSLGELALDLNAVALADAFLSDIASRIYGVALRPLTMDAAPDRWREQVDKDKERFRRFQADLAQAARETARDSYRDAMQLDAPELADQRASAGFYNRLDRSSESKRSDSLIYHLRCLNNFVKSVVIKEALGRALASMMRDPGTGINVLDLACGKGADMRKITTAAKTLKVQIENYVGIDIARNSLNDAVSRLESMPAKHRPNFSVRYVAADLGQHAVSSKPDGDDDFRRLEQWDNRSQEWVQRPPSETISVNQSFDLVTMQFSLHYMFQNSERANHFFSTLSRHMRPGSVFIATTVYADEMLRKLMQAGPGADSFTIRDDAGVATCRVRFDPAFLRKQFRSGDPDGEDPMEGDDAEDDDPMMGIRYTFTLLDGDSEDAQAVNAPEWLVPQMLLVKLATAHNFRLVRYERLPNCAERHITHDGNRPDALYRFMNVLNHEGTIPSTDWEIASLYVVVELQKEEKPADMSEALSRLRERIANYKSLPKAERARLLNTMMNEPE